MNIIFFQIEEYSMDKAIDLFEVFSLSKDRDKIYAPRIRARDIEDKSRLYENKHLTASMAEYIKNKNGAVAVIEDNPWSRLLAFNVSYEAGIRFFPAVADVEFLNEEKLFLKRMAFQSNVLIGSKSDKQAVVTMNIPVRKGASKDKSKKEISDVIITEEIEVKHFDKDGELLGTKSDVCSLKNAKMVFVCGSGVGSKENANKVFDLAKKYNAAIGATRPVVANGWLAPETLIGISGAFIAPEICIVLGASGSQAFMAGINGSEKIISINKDRLAPIVNNSDVALIGDCMEFASKLFDMGHY